MESTQIESVIVEEDGKFYMLMNLQLKGIEETGEEIKPEITITLK